jgi:hypothetical protein
MYYLNLAVCKIDNKPNTKCESNYQRHLYRNGTAGKPEDELCGEGDYGDEEEVDGGENKRVLFYVIIENK